MSDKKPVIICSTEGCNTRLNGTSIEIGKCYQCRRKTEKGRSDQHKKTKGFAAPRKVVVDCMNKGDGHAHKKVVAYVASGFKGRPKKICYMCYHRAESIGIDYLNAPKHSVEVFV